MYYISTVSQCRVELSDSRVGRMALSGQSGSRSQSPVALAVMEGGVHVGQVDLIFERVRKPRMLLGVGG